MSRPVVVCPVAPAGEQKAPGVTVRTPGAGGAGTGCSGGAGAGATGTGCCGVAGAGAAGIGCCGAAGAGAGGWAGPWLAGVVEASCLGVVALLGVSSIGLALLDAEEETTESVPGGDDVAPQPESSALAVSSISDALRQGRSVLRASARFCAVISRPTSSRARGSVHDEIGLLRVRRPWADGYPPALTTWAALHPAVALGPADAQSVRPGLREGALRPVGDGRSVQMVISRRSFRRLFRFRRSRHRGRSRDPS